MFKIGRGITRTCRGLTRREILEAGGLGFRGLTLAEWFGVKGAVARAAARPAAARPADATDREHSCIFIFLSGGPSHFETFDPKATAPVEIRGPYASIPTSVSGIRTSELLPQIARQMDKCALIRSMVTRDMHAGTYVVSGGHRGNASLGAVLQHLQGTTRRGMPPFVQVGPNGYLPGGGSLGTTFNPLIVNDPSRTVKLPEFTLIANDYAGPGRRSRGGAGHRHPESPGRRKLKDVKRRPHVGCHATAAGVQGESGFGSHRESMRMRQETGRSPLTHPDKTRGPRKHGSPHEHATPGMPFHRSYLPQPSMRMKMVVSASWSASHAP